MITGASDDIPALQGIYHERAPILLSAEAMKVWLDPATTPKAALELLRAAPVPVLTVKEVPKKEKVEKAPKVIQEKPPKVVKGMKPKDERQTALDL